MINNVDVWEREGYLISVPEYLKEEAVKRLRIKELNVIRGRDYRCSPEDYDQLIIDFLNEEIGENLQDD